MPEEIIQIYRLLLLQSGLKIREIADTLNMDRFYVSKMLLSADNRTYWQTDMSGKWYAIKGAMTIEQENEESQPIKEKVTRHNKFDSSELSKRFKEPRLKSFLDIINTYPILDEAGCQKLLDDIDDDDSATNELVKGLMWMVVKYAMNVSSDVPIFDKIQEGTISLFKAIQTWNSERSMSFIEYARRLVIRDVWCYCKQHRCFYLPLSFIRVHEDIKEVCRAFYVKNEISPAFWQVYDSSCTTESTSKLAYDFEDDLSRMFVSYDDMDIFVDETAESPDITLSKKEISERMEKALCNLEPRELSILYMSYGIDRLFPATHTEISELYGITYERARQILNTAKKNLKGSYRLTKLWYDS